MEKIKNLQKGFTLVELLVVIGVLGILAAGLLATIDPLEQFRKGADSNRKTTALELVNGLTRYYATKGVMPWKTGGDATCIAAFGTPPSATLVSNPSSASSFGSCLTALFNEGELKETFLTQYSILSKLSITDIAGTGTSVAVCYDPESKSESKRTGETIYTQAGASGCNPATSDTCYWCAR